jgi:NTP pyrophosphatase (non-canonical NTP hydrolase)
MEYLLAERDRAIGKHGYQNTPAWPYMSDKDRLVILVEEVGEVARAMTYDEGNEIKLLEELIQVAAMALMWAEGKVHATT